jgi:hypothetical protein
MILRLVLQNLLMQRQRDLGSSLGIDLMTICIVSWTDLGFAILFCDTGY